jgi:hypothetical protein
MAQIKHQLYPGIIIETENATTEPGGGYLYKVSGDGGATFFPLPSSIGVAPDVLERDINNKDSASYLAMDSLLQDLTFLEQGPEPILRGTVGPSLQQMPALALGSFADVGNLALAVPDVGINFLDWAFKGFEGDIPSRRYLSSDPRDVVGGSEQLARGMEYVGDLARAGTRATQEAELNVPLKDIPVAGSVFDYFGLGDAQVGAKTAFDIFSFDTSPDVSTKERQWISLITQVTGAAPLEAVLIAKLAQQLAISSGSPTAQKVYEAISDLPINSPLKSAAVETGAGALASTGMVGSLEALESAYPEAPQWMKNVVMAGGGVGLPIAGMTVGATVYDVALKTPIVSWPLRIARGAMDNLTPSGAERAAARSLQTMGGDWKNRSEILGVMGQLKIALAEGRDIDRVTRIAFTTPQLARNEARVIEAQLNAAEKNMPSAQVSEQRQLIEELRRFANFQEGHLLTLTEGGNIGAIAYPRYSDRMMDRRDKIFAALDESILKLDLGGKVDDDIPESVIQADYERGLATQSFEYNKNRIRAFQEGILALEPKQSQAVSQAYESTLSKIDEALEQSMFDAQERVQAIRESMPENMSDSDRADFNMWIRREIDTAYKEIDGYEDALWNNISGMDRPKTDTVTNADGTDLGPEILIGGVPIGEHFAAQGAALQAGEDVNQSKYLWKLAGRTALVDQASKGGGPDSEKVARQHVIVREQESIVAERQRQLGVAAENLNTIRQAEQPAENTALTKAQDSFEKAQERLNTAQTGLEKAQGNLQISLGKDVDFEGSAVRLEDEINDSSILGVKMVNDVPVGRSAQEVQNIISNLKREMSFEQGRPVRNAQKVKAIGGLIDDLQRAIADSENFSVDIISLDAARKMTATKKALFERGSVGKLRGFTTKGEPQVSVERTIEKIAPATTQETSLRELQAALTPVATGEGTPFRLVQTEDGGIVAQLDPDYNLERYATAPPAPFESIRVDGGRSLGLKVADDTPATEANIKLIRDTLWDRFRAFNSGDEFNSSGAQTWINRNRAAINWLGKATGKDTGFENLTSAERIVQSIKSAHQGNLDRTIEALRKDGAFKPDPRRDPDDQFTEEGLRILIKEAAKRESNLNSAATFLDAPSPLVMGHKFFEQYLNDPRVLDETLKVLENGALPDGTNPALDGFKQAVAEELIQRGLTGPGEGTTAGIEARRVSQSVGSGEIKLWDPQKLFGLSQDPRVGKLLGDLFGEDAAAAFSKVAEGARLQQAVGPSAAPGIRVEDLISDEWAGNVGRFIGGWTAKGLPISSLVLTGLGRRYGVNVIGNVRGQAMENLIVEFLMDPKLAMAAVEKWPTMDPNKQLGLKKRAMIWAHRKFISDNARRIERLGKRPGTLFEIGAEATGLREPDEEIGEEIIAPQSSAAPVARPLQRVASAMPAPRAPSSASALSQVNPVGPPPMAQGPMAQGPMAQGPMAQGTMEKGQQLFGANDIVFSAAHGGYADKNSGIMSIKCKPQQIVG